VSVVKLAAVKVKSLDEIKVEKEKPSLVDQHKDNSEVNDNSVCLCVQGFFQGAGGAFAPPLTLVCPPLRILF